MERTHAHHVDKSETLGDAEDKSHYSQRGLSAQTYSVAYD